MNTTHAAVAPTELGLVELNANELTEIQGGAIPVLAIWIGRGLLCAAAGYVVGRYLL